MSASETSLKVRYIKLKASDWLIDNINDIVTTLSVLFQGAVISDIQLHM